MQVQSLLKTASLPSHATSNKVTGNNTGQIQFLIVLSVCISIMRAFTFHQRSCIFDPWWLSSYFSRIWLDACVLRFDLSRLRQSSALGRALADGEWGEPAMSFDLPHRQAVLGTLLQNLDTRVSRTRYKRVGLTQRDSIKLGEKENALVKSSLWRRARRVVGRRARLP